MHFCQSLLEQPFAVQVTSITQENKKDPENLFKTGIERQIQGRLLIILNLDSLQTRIENLNLKFAKTGITNEKLDDLFPLSDKKNAMKTRKNEKYRVEFANTNRYKNSSIISMQNMLNEDAKNT